MSRWPAAGHDAVAAAPCVHSTCPDCAAPAALSRRAALRLGGFALATVGVAAGPAATARAAAAPVEVFPGLVVNPREAWARGDLSPRGPMESEAAGDVRFLLVHHTASSNEYRPDEVALQLRSFFRYHTGPDKRWPDIAYNFLVDRHGGVWEGRAGSLAAPVQPDATGGSQGFAQLACFIGDLTASPPTSAARASMLRVLAWMADRYAIDTTAGATATFVSRGSSRHAAGTTVVTATIAGHRDMSLTTCPGDGVYDDVRRSFPEAVTALQLESASPPSGPAASPDEGAAPAAPRAPLPSASRAPSAPTATSDREIPSASSTSPGLPAGTAAAAAAAAGAGVMWHRRRRRVTADQPTSRPARWPDGERPGPPDPLDTEHYQEEWS
jgi:hypothetical protein